MNVESLSQLKEEILKYQFYRKSLAASVQCLSSSGKIVGCDISSPGLEARGVVLDRHSHVDMDTCTVHDTWNSGVWARGESTCTITSSTVIQCGGYGAIYSTNGAVIKVSFSIFDASIIRKAFLNFGLVGVE